MLLVPTTELLWIARRNLHTHRRTPLVSSRRNGENCLFFFEQDATESRQSLATSGRHVTTETRFEQRSLFFFFFVLVGGFPRGQEQRMLERGEVTRLGHFIFFFSHCVRYE